MKAKTPAENPLEIADGDPLLTPGQVAAVMKVHPKTVSRWAKSGKLVGIRTPGKHMRFRLSAVRKLMGRNADALTIDLTFEERRQLAAYARNLAGSFLEPRSHRMLNLDARQTAHRRWLELAHAFEPDSEPS